ncbi:hypothetical protein ACQZ61_04120 [Agrobacterium vitis]|uniref:hypothetical protein n=1 Tax=Agrobacterium vitis TaxID=373 RepID=UPI001F1E7A1A|nr:hypothetical protein [Agrobacterium vitis]MCF1452290.1 hypothetical protein [Agrobacterium vitis]
MKDLHSNISRVVAIGNATLAADNTPAAIDLRGYDSAEVCLDIGAGGITFSSTNKIEFVLTHSDDGTTYTNVADADMLGVSSISNGIIKALTSAHAAAAVYRYGYKGGKRYLKLLADFGGTHGAGTPIAASVILGNGFGNPQANQA